MLCITVVTFHVICLPYRHTNQHYNHSCCILYNLYVKVVGVWSQARLISYKNLVYWLCVIPGPKFELKYFYFSPVMVLTLALKGGSNIPFEKMISYDFPWPEEDWLIDWLIDSWLIVHYNKKGLPQRFRVVCGSIDIVVGYTTNVYKLDTSMLASTGSILSFTSMHLGCLVPADLRWFIKFPHH